MPSTFTIVADRKLFTQVSDNPKPPKQFPLSIHYTHDNISKKSHIAPCKSPWSPHPEHVPRHASRWVLPLAQRQARDSGGQISLK